MNPKPEHLVVLSSVHEYNQAVENKLFLTTSHVLLISEAITPKIVGALVSAGEIYSISATSTQLASELSLLSTAVPVFHVSSEANWRELIGKLTANPVEVAATALNGVDVAENYLQAVPT